MVWSGASGTSSHGVEVQFLGAGTPIKRESSSSETSQGREPFGASPGPSGPQTHRPQQPRLHAKPAKPTKLTPDPDSFVRERKICIFGHRCTGKTSIVEQYVKNMFSHEHYPASNKMSSKRVKRKQREYIIHILDTVGQDECGFFDPQYTIGTDGYMLVYSATSRESFEMIKNIYNELWAYTPFVPFILVATKSDLLAERQVSEAEGRRLGTQWGCPYLESSSRSSALVHALFDTLLEKVDSAYDDSMQPRPPPCVRAIRDMALLGGDVYDSNQASLTYICDNSLHVVIDAAVEALLVHKPEDVRGYLGDFFAKYQAGTPPDRMPLPKSRPESEKYLRKHNVAPIIEEATAAVLKEKPKSDEVHLYLAKFFGGMKPTSKCIKGESDLEEFTPKVFCGQSINMPVTKGQVVWYCRCGYSQNQPYCDGQHRDIAKQYGVKIFPEKYEATEDGIARFCGCRKSDKSPLCDYSHLQLSAEEKALRVPITYDYEPWVITHKAEHTHDTFTMTVRKQTGSGLAMSSTNHFSIQNSKTGKARPYTPIAYDDVDATATFVIKKIPEGLVSQHLSTLNVNDVVPMKGPSPGEYHYTRNESGLTYLLLAGGSGITPIYQMLDAINQAPQGNKVHFAYSNKTREDIMIRAELDAILAALEQKNILASKAFCVSRAAADATLLAPLVKGRITKELVGQMVEGSADKSKVRAIMCGTPGFNRSMYEACRAAGLDQKQVIFC